MAKAAPWVKIDAHARKRGEQTVLDTLVVHATYPPVGNPRVKLNRVFFPR